MNMKKVRNNSVKIIEVCKVAPAAKLPESLSLPLTFFDTYFLNVPVTEVLFFYSLDPSDPPFSTSNLLPKLKHSLSQTLSHFLPLAGNIIWPRDYPKPILHYKPGDGISLTVAETDADFHHLSGNHVREVEESHPLLPELTASEAFIPAMALQITVFPNSSGFSMGFAMHQAVLDGRTAIMFFKSWAHLSINEGLPLALELTPCFDRSFIKDPTGIDMFFINFWQNSIINSKNSNLNTKNLQCFQTLGLPPNMVRQTFVLTCSDTEKLKQKIAYLLNKSQKTKLLRLSTVMAVYAYAVKCLVKALRLEGRRKVYIGLHADLRARLDPPIPENYFGNCVGDYYAVAEAEELEEEDGVAVVYKKIMEAIEELKSKAVKRVEECLSRWNQQMEAGAKRTSFAWSPALRFYGIEYGWGKPLKVEMTSIDKTGDISIIDNGGGDGGVEVGLVLPRDEMERFASLFGADLRVLVSGL